MQSIETRIVGDFARPLTKLLLPMLQTGTELILKREPENPHDPVNAIAVYATITPEMKASLEKEPGIENFNLDEPYQLGYIPKTENVFLKGAERMKATKDARNKTSISVEYD